jgi:hypothetical protein
LFIEGPYTTKNTASGKTNQGTLTKGEEGLSTFDLLIKEEQGVSDKFCSFHIFSLSYLFWGSQCSIFLAYAQKLFLF